MTSSTLEWTVVRPTMIYGAPGDRNIERLVTMLRRTPIVPLPGGGKRLQQPVHVQDLAMSIVKALERPGTVGHCYDIAGPEAITFEQLVRQAADAIGRRPRVVPVPLRLTIRSVRVYERLARRPRIKAEQLERLAEDKAFDITDARRDLDFDPRSFAKGIAEEVKLLL